MAVDDACRQGVCPCSQPEQPAADFVCYSTPLSIEEDEAMRYQPHLDEYADAGELNRLEGQGTTHAPCPTYPGQWFHKSTGACSCGASHQQGTGGLRA